MLQRLPIANIINKIRQIKYSFYWFNILNSIKLENRMGTIFMNSENSKTSDPHRLLLGLSNKIDLKRSDKYVTLSNLSI